VVVAVRAGKIVTLAGPPIINGVILIKNGKIAAVGKKVAVPKDAIEIDARAKVVIPGLVAAFSTLADQADSEESVAPDVRAREGFDFSRDYRRFLEGGVTTVYLATSPRRLVSGQGAVVKLAGASPFARTLQASADVRVVLGAYVKNPPALFRPPIPPTSDALILPAQRQFPSVRPSEFAVLRQLFVEARRAGLGTAGWKAVNRKTGERSYGVRTGDPKLLALAPILNGDAPLRVNAGTAVDIREALHFADDFQIKLVLEGATEAWQLAGEIARHHVPVVVETPLRPGQPVSDDYTRDVANGKVDLRNVAMLVKAGVRVALAPPTEEELPDLLPLAACQVAYGVAPDAALRMVTADAAEILGVRSRVGTIEVGKDADLVILDGDPLDSRSHVEKTLVGGDVVYTRRAPASAASGGKVGGQGRLIAIRAGKILTVTQGEITDGVLLVRDGRIVAINREPVYPPDAEVIDASHSVVMPGMIDMHSYLGLHADAEPAPLNPAFAAGGPASGRTRLLNALKPNDPAFAEALHGGVTAILLAPPTGGPISGQAALLKTALCPDHATVCKDRVVKELAALCFNMQGGSPRMAQPWSFRDLLQAAKGYNQRRIQYERDLKEWERARDEAKAKGKDEPKEPAEVPKDDDMEPLAALFRSEIPALVHVNRADEIVNALKIFRDEFDLPTTLVDAGDGFRVAEEIQKRNTPVALGPNVTHREKGMRINTADVLARAGVRILFQSSATSGTQFLRQNAAYAVRNGLDPTEALRALTLYPARTLQVEARLGSLEVGKDADIVILSGDPMELQSRIERVLVNGKVVYDGK
jgi:imidazolonepropionase-like amidohydrolase